MLAQLQVLRLVIGADALAVEGVGARQHFFVDEAADDLACSRMNGTSRERTSSTARARREFGIEIDSCPGRSGAWHFAKRVIVASSRRLR
jgi:hypothetical protein